MGHKITVIAYFTLDLSSEDPSPDEERCGGLPMGPPPPPPPPPPLAVLLREVLTESEAILKLGFHSDKADFDFKTNLHLAWSLLLNVLGHSTDYS